MTSPPWTWPYLKVLLHGRVKIPPLPSSKWKRYNNNFLAYPAPGLSGNDFLCRAGDVGWDLGIFTTEFPYLLLGKLLADFDFILPRTNEAGTATVELSTRELDRDDLTGPPWLWLCVPWGAIGGGMRDSQLWALRDFSNSNSFCMSSGDIWRAPLGSPATGSAGTSERFGVATPSSSSPTVSSRGGRLVLILSGYKNSSCVPVRRRAYKNIKQILKFELLCWSMGSHKGRYFLFSSFYCVYALREDVNIQTKAKKQKMSYGSDSNWSVSH